MKDNNVFIAFDSKKTAYTIAKMVISEGYEVAGVAKDLIHLKTILSYYKGGILIMGSRFCSMAVDDLLEDVSDDVDVILIGNINQLATCHDERVFKLALPLKKNDLICSVEMFISVDNASGKVPTKSVADDKLISRAKRVLIDRYDMNEEQAHRYIQKKSMDSGKKLVDIAKIIVSL
jgi:response regulator NasT